MEENKNDFEISEDVVPQTQNSDTAKSVESTSSKGRISISTFVCSCIAICLVVVMITLTACSSFFRNKYVDQILGGAMPGVALDDSVYADIATLDMIFKNYTFEDIDNEEVKIQLLKAYVNATGDRYAAYYTDEEYAELVNSSMLGNFVGIGVKVIESSVTVGGVEYKAMKVVDVVKDAPAHKGGVLPLRKIRRLTSSDMTRH